MRQKTMLNAVASRIILGANAALVDALIDGQGFSLIISKRRTRLR